jgi:hypothetical protein
MGRCFTSQDVGAKRRLPAHVSVPEKRFCP